MNRRARVEAYGHRGGRVPPKNNRLDWLIVTSPSAARRTRPSRTGASRSRLLGSVGSAPKGKNHPQEYPLPLVPRQQPVQAPMASADDLAGHHDDRVHEPLELHPQQAALLLAMTFLV